MPNASECYEAMGFMVFQFQQLENELIDFLCDLIDSNTADLPQILCTKMSFKVVLDVLNSVSAAKKVKPEFLQRLEKIIGQAAKVEQDRNRYIHSHYDMISWHGLNVEFKRAKHRINKKRLYVYELEEFKPESLRNLAREIDDVFLETMKLRDDVMMDLHPDRYSPDFDHIELDEPPEELLRLIQGGKPQDTKSPSGD